MAWLILVSLDDEALLLVGVCYRYRAAFRRHIASDSSRLLGRQGAANESDFTVDRYLVVDLVARAEISLASLFSPWHSRLGLTDLVSLRWHSHRVSRATVQDTSAPSQLTMRQSQCGDTAEGYQ